MATRALFRKQVTCVLAGARSIVCGVQLDGDELKCTILYIAHKHLMPASGCRWAQMHGGTTGFVTSVNQIVGVL